MPRPILAALLLVLTLADHARAQQTPTAFTYQGRLKLDGVPLDRPANARFRLHAHPEDDQQVGPDLVRTLTPDADGVFSATLNFGPVFGPDTLHLEIAVSNPDNPGLFIPLEPRTAILPVPVAQFALDAPPSTLAEVTGGLAATATGPARIEIHTDSDFDGGLRLLGSPGQASTYAPLGVRATDNFTINTTDRFFVDANSGYAIDAPAGSGTIEAASTLKLSVDSASLTMNAATVSIAAPVRFDANAAIIDLEAQAQLDLSASVVRLSGGAIFLNDHVAGAGGTLQVSQTLSVGLQAFKPGGGLWGSSSDARLKKNVLPIPGALDRFNALRPVSFEFIDPDGPHGAPGTFLGFIAQEVQRVLPAWVTEADDGTLMLTPQGFDALTVRAIQELDEQHRRETDELRRENARLRARLDALERALLGPAERQ